MGHGGNLDGLVEPIKAGQIKKGMFALLNGKPCRIHEVTVSKTGKHGHAKCHFHGTDIFTKKKVEGLESSTHYMNMPFVTKQEYDVIGMDEEGYMTLMDDAQATREDLKLPDGDAHEKLREDFMKAYEAEESIVVSVTKSMNTEMILDFKVVNE